MAETKIGMKIEEEIKELNELCKEMVEIAKSEVKGGVDNFNTHDLLEFCQSIGAIADAKKDTVEACYKIYIAEAMEKNEDDYGETWDENGRMNYRGQARDSQGRFVSSGMGRRRMGYVEPMQYQMDMELYRMNPDELRRKDDMRGVHFYSEQGDRGQNQGGSTSGNSGRRMYDNGYEDGFSQGQRSGGSRMERARRNYEEKHDMESLEELMNSIKEEVEKQKPHMDANQKNMTKSKLTNLVNMMNS